MSERDGLVKVEVWGVGGKKEEEEGVRGPTLYILPGNDAKAANRQNLEQKVLSPLTPSRHYRRRQW